MIYRKGIGNIDWRGNLEYTMVVGIEREQEEHSCVDDSDNVRVL